MLDVPIKHFSTELRLAVQKDQRARIAILTPVPRSRAWQHARGFSSGQASGS
jgi:hypothetical protein